MFFPSLFISIARAAESAQYRLNYQFPGGPQAVESPADYVNMVFRFGLGIVGIIALAVIVYGGIRYILSAGNPSALADAKSQMLSALIGITLLLSSYVILREINPNLVELKNPALSEITPEAKFNLGALRVSWKVLGNNLEAIKAKIEEIKKMDTDTYKAWLTSMSDEQRLTYFRGLDPIAQRNFIATLSGLNIPFSGVATQLDTNEVIGTYEALAGRPAQTDVLRRLNAQQTTQLYYHYDAQHQQYLLAQMSKTQYAPFYAVLKSQDATARAQGKESNHTRYFLEQVSEYYENDLRVQIVTAIYQNMADSERQQFLRDVRTIDSNLASDIGVVLSN